ncbi:MAG: carboxypeptidase-like regulatory domain-containing protein [Gammaproteobacteria bacterium]|nr:carboxypeptidase-like regulatory domain-containing protein [Gammaproteobacteria bacterium]
MKRLIILMLCGFLLTAWPLYGNQTSSVEFRIVSQHADAEAVWLGVFVGPVNSDTEALSWTSAESDEFTLEIPQTDEEVLLLALRRNFVPITVRITDDLRSSGIDLDFKPGHQFLGTIVSTDGIEVADAVLSIERQDLPSQQIPSQAKLEWTSAVDGTVSIGGLVPGKHELHVELPYIPTEIFDIQINEGEDAEGDLVLGNAHCVRGSVLDHDRNLVAGADVSASFDIDGEEFSQRSSVQTDSAGEFQMGPFVSGQAVYLSAAHADHGSTFGSRVFAGNHEVQLILSKLVEVVGTVLDAETGTPVEEFTLRVRGYLGLEFPHSGTNGTISVKVDSDAHGLVIEAPNYIPYFHTEFSPGTMEVYDLGKVELDPGVHVTGLVYDSISRQPVEGAQIASIGKGIDREDLTESSIRLAHYMNRNVNATSDADGEFSLGPLPSGDSVLQVFAKDYKWEQIPFDGQSARINIELTPSDVRPTRIVGRIESNHGVAVAGQVNFYHVENASGVGFQTEEDGSFEYATRAGTHQVYANTDLGRSETIEVTVDEGITEEVVLVVDPFGRLEGTINGLKGAERAHVLVFSDDSRVGSVGGISNGEEFRIAGLGAGSFTARAATTMDRQLTKSFEVTENSGNVYVEFSFAADSRLYGRVLSLGDPSSFRQVRAIPKESSSISGRCDILDDGSFEIRGLSNGEYWIEVADPQLWGVAIDSESNVYKRIEVEIAGETELNIDLASP